MAERSPAQRARVLLEQESEMTLATIDDGGRPWVSPVFYALDDEHRLYWTSDVDARHSAALRTAAAVAIVVHGRLDGRTDAVYLDATAVELSGEAEVREGIAVMARGNDRQPDRWWIDGIDDVTGDGPWRVYRATPQEVWVRELRTKGGRRVVGRVPADLGG